MEALAQNRRSSIVRIPICQLERATRDLAWRSFRARVAHFVRSSVPERLGRRALGGLEAKSG